MTTTIEGKINIGLVADLNNGCDVFGRSEAVLIRELHKEHPDWLDIIDNIKELEKLKGSEYPLDNLPYFGVILTGKGKEGFQKIMSDIFG